jgi:hypothetical protein
MHRRAALWVCAGAGIWIRLCARVLRGADGWCGDRVWWGWVLLAGEVRGFVDRDKCLVASNNRHRSNGPRS